MKKFFTIQEVCLQLGKSYQQVFGAHWRKRVPEPRKVGRTRLYSPADIEKLQGYFKSIEDRGKSD